jgi:predicted nucleic acid-binding protein
VSGFVIDASAILSWCFVEEQPKDAEALLQRLVAAGLAAPAHWPFEVANILWVAERKRRIDAAAANVFVDLIEMLGVALDAQSSAMALKESRALALAHNLTVYDAAYLELALRRGAGLVSKDNALLSAAEAAGVRTVAV